MRNRSTRSRPSARATRRTRGGRRRAGGSVVELGGDVDLVPGDAGGGDGLADALLVAVHLRGVDVPVADLEGGGHRRRGLRRRDLEDAEAELGDGGSVVQGDRGNSHDCSYPLPWRDIPRRAPARRATRRRSRPVPRGVSLPNASERVRPAVSVADDAARRARRREGGHGSRLGCCGTGRRDGDRGGARPGAGRAGGPARLGVAAHPGRPARPGRRRRHRLAGLRPGDVRRPRRHGHLSLADHRQQAEGRVRRGLPGPGDPATLGGLRPARPGRGRRPGRPGRPGPASP